jgi:glycosyltransferase involved in cell wall biosynthesis
MTTVLVVNFNGPELNELARHLAARERLAAFVRPYVNRGRAWERAVAALPLLGRTYAETFGRRRIEDPRLLALTHEAGVLADVAAAAVARIRGLPTRVRRRWTHGLHDALRQAVSETAADRVGAAQCVVAFTGFAREAFRSVRARTDGTAVLNYPIAHHRYHRRLRAEEIEREPAFASTWQGFEDWTPAYEAQVDEEIADADAILVGSRFARDTFTAEGIDATKLVVANYGVDAQMFSPASEHWPSKRFNVVFAGQIGQRKGISYLLRAYRAFVRSDSQLTLVGSVVGSAKPLLPYRELLRHLPHLTRPALAETFRESDVLVFPSLVEGMGLVVLEAMACGLPVIVTPNGPADVVRDGVDGYIVPSRDENAICDRLDRLYRDRDLRIEMGRNARARALEFTWAAYAANVERILDDLMSKNRAGPS